MASLPDLVTGLLCSLSWVLRSCPCIQNIAQHHLTRTLFSFSPMVISLLVFSSLSFYSFSTLIILYVCQIRSSLTNVPSNVLFLEVHTFPNNLMVPISGWVLMCCSFSVQTYHKWPRTGNTPLCLYKMKCIDCPWFVWNANDCTLCQENLRSLLFCFPFRCTVFANIRDSKGRSSSGRTWLPCEIFQCCVV